MLPTTFVHPLDTNYAYDYDAATVEPSDAEIELLAMEIGPRTTAEEVGQIIRIAIAAKKNAEAQATEWKGVENLARERLAEVFQATGQANWSTPAGKAYRAADSVTVSWDAKALDALCASSPQIAAVLAPHRRETVRSGALTIRGLS
jgi:hypothetical protein